MSSCTNSVSMDREVIHRDKFSNLLMFRCNNQHPDGERSLLRNNSIIIDFGQQSNLLRSRKFSCKFIEIIVELGFS